DPRILPLPRERAMCEWIVSDPIALSVHVSCDRKRLQIEHGTVAHQATIQIRRNRIATTAPRNSPDHAVIVDVDDLVSQAVKPPADRIDDDVVGPGVAEDHSLDHVIM